MNYFLLFFDWMLFLRWFKTARLVKEKPLLFQFMFVCLSEASLTFILHKNMGKSEKFFTHSLLHLMNTQCSKKPTVCWRNPWCLSNLFCCLFQFISLKGSFYSPHHIHSIHKCRWTINFSLYMIAMCKRIKKKIWHQKSIWVK